MRVIERQMIQAIIERKNFKKANTEVIKDGDFMYIYLHDNLIAKYGLNDNWGQLFISHCNWLTNTTKSRLNALIGFVDGLGGIYQKNLAIDSRFRWILILMELEHTTKSASIKLGGEYVVCRLC